MEPRWITHARRLIGVKQLPGPRHEARIVRMWEAIKAPFRDDETAWCAAFVGSVLEEVGITSTRSAAARSYTQWGVACAQRLGAVVVFSRPPSTWSGHVGFLVGRDPRGRLMVLGGNQGDAVNIAPFDTTRVLAYRWPLNELFPTSAVDLPIIASAAKSSTNEA